MDGCGDPDTSYWWSSYWFQYCSFTCHMYAFRYYSIIMAIIIVFMSLLKIIPIYSIIICPILLLESVYGFTRKIDTSFKDNHPEYKNYTNTEIIMDEMRDLKCFSCGTKLSLDDKYCPKCNKSTNEELMRFYASS